MRRITALAVAAAVLVACGGNDDDPPPTTESTTTTEAATTTEATTTTLSQAEQDEASIRKLVNDLNGYWLTLTNPPNPTDPKIDQFYLDPVRQRIIDILQSDSQRGAITSGDLKWEIQSIDTDGTDEATVLLCQQDDTYAELDDGTRVFEGSGEAQTYEYHVRRTSNGWRVFEEITIGDPCEIAEPSQ